LAGRRKRKRRTEPQIVKVFDFADVTRAATSSATRKK
jgi:hypothetical protein